MKTFALLVAAAWALPAQPARTVDKFETSRGEVAITPIQHASLLIQGGGQAIYIDPTGQGNYEGLPPADLILVTHAHGDHLNAAEIARLRKPGVAVVGPPAVADAVPGTAVMRAGEMREFGDWRIEAIEAYNLKRGPRPGALFHPKGTGVGYVLSFGGKRFYISGDTEDIPEMRALKNIDVAFVCMNQPYTMTPDEAAAAVLAFKPRIVYPYHDRGTDVAAFEKALEGSGIEVRIRDWYH
jgi:L-ascorbate metabolism protein UlaG (beta-lactamase superfamily)